MKQAIQILDRHRKWAERRYAVANRSRREGRRKVIANNSRMDSRGNALLSTIAELTLAIDTLRQVKPPAVLAR